MLPSPLRPGKLRGAHGCWCSVRDCCWPVTLGVTQLWKCVRFNAHVVSNMSYRRPPLPSRVWLALQLRLCGEVQGASIFWKLLWVGGGSGGRQMLAGRARGVPENWRLAPAPGGQCQSMPASFRGVPTQDPFPVSQDMSPVLQEAGGEVGEGEKCRLPTRGTWRTRGGPAGRTSMGADGGQKLRAEVERDSSINREDEGDDTYLLCSTNSLGEGKRGETRPGRQHIRHSSSPPRLTGPPRPMASSSQRHPLPCPAQTFPQYPAAPYSQLDPLAPPAGSGQLISDAIQILPSPNHKPCPHTALWSPKRD